MVVQRQRYEVHEHAFGRPPITSGPMAGCFAFATHRWVRISRKPLAFAPARKLADAQTHHAVVAIADTNTKVHDNGKAPRLPEGWKPAEFAS